MAKICEVCGNEQAYGRIISHANTREAPRALKLTPAAREGRGTGSSAVRVCTRCIRSKKVTKAA